MTESTKKRLLALGPDGKPTFEYIPAARTSVAATFERIREQLRAESQAQAVQAASNVKQMKKVKP